MTKQKPARKKKEQTKIELVISNSYLKLAKQVFEAEYPNFEFSVEALFKEMVTEKAVKIGLIQKVEDKAINYAQVVTGITLLNDRLKSFLEKETLKVLEQPKKIEPPKPQSLVDFDSMIQAIETTNYSMPEDFQKQIEAEETAKQLALSSL